MHVTLEAHHGREAAGSITPPPGELCHAAMTPWSAFFLLFFFFFFLGLHLRHMEVSRLGVESELEPLAYTTATAMWDLSHICDYTAAHSRSFLNPLSGARDRT